MNRKLKAVVAAAAVLICLSAFCFPAAALTESEYDGLVEQQLSEIGADSLGELANSETGELMDDLGIGEPYSAGYFEFTPENLIKLAESLKKPAVLAPFTTAITILATLLVCRIIKGVSDGGKLSGFEQANDYFCLCAVCAALLPTLLSQVEKSLAAIDGLSTISTGFIPVFAAAVAGSGQPISASLAASGLFSVTELSVWACEYIVSPMCAVFLALGIAGALGGDMPQATGPLKTVIVTLIGGLAAIFTAVLSLKAYISAAADSFSVRAAKALVSGTVPVVGGGLSESVSAIFSCLSIVKSSVGFFGIALIFLTFIPHIAALFCWKISLALCAGAADGFGQSRTKKLLTAAGAMTDMLLAVFALLTAAMIVSIAAIIKTAQ